MAFPRQWDGTAWQQYSLRLAHERHGAENVQQIPDKVRGDCGVEFFTMGGCLYQCYAPEEVHDIQKAASGMKGKAYKDLRKLEKYKDTLAEILQQLKITRWILLCPFLDDKEVVAYVREQGEIAKAIGLPFISSEFVALVQSQEDFEGEIAALRIRSLGPPLKVAAPTDADVQSKFSGTLAARLQEKLARAFPGRSSDERQKRAERYVRSLLLRDNTLETLRTDHPVLWERSANCLQAEEQRLGALGIGEGHPSAQLRESIERIENSLRQDLSGLSGATITNISVGTVGDWLVRCPLDFPAQEDS